jgi:hypothetical protein
MSLILEIGAFFLGRQLADYVDTSIDLKKEQLTQAQMQNEILRLQMQVAELEAEKSEEFEEPLSEPDEWDIKMMKQLSEIRKAIAKKED